MFNEFFHSAIFDPSIQLRQEVALHGLLIKCGVVDVDSELSSKDVLELAEKHLSIDYE